MNQKRKLIMKKRTKIRKNIVIGLTILLTTLPVSAQVEFTGDLSAVSTYVWRGVKANNGPALQSTAAGSLGNFTLGFWGSSVNFGDDVEVETDMFADISLSAGDFVSSLGATVYMFDFRTFNNSADAEIELYASLSYDAFGLAVYYVPKQNSTKSNLNRSNYWLEMSGGTVMAGVDLSAMLAYGTYSSRWLPDGPKKDAAALLLLAAGKSINDELAITWTYSLDLGSGFENIFYFGGTHGF
jgi:uncharacterized protein (TIGR02001 family)